MPASASARGLLLLVVASLLAFAALYAGALGTERGRWIDEGGMLHGWDGVDFPRFHRAATELVTALNVGTVAAAVLAGVGLALILRRPRAGVLAGLVTVTAANVTTQALKPALARAHLFEGELARTLPGSFPSGHATLAMSLALALVLVAPAPWRPLAAVAGGVYAGLVGIGLVALGWHYPSDVAGGYLCAMSWAAAGAAVHSWIGAPKIERAARQLPTARMAGAAVAGALGLLVLVLAILERRPDIVFYGRAHTGFFAAAVGMLALATALPSTLLAGMGSNRGLVRQALARVAAVTAAIAASALLLGSYAKYLQHLQDG